MNSELGISGRDLEISSFEIVVTYRIFLEVLNKPIQTQCNGGGLIQCSWKAWQKSFVLSKNLQPYCFPLMVSVFLFSEQEILL
jgi:hypothetical protein